ncbi:hypothetical protein OG21DRAFT_102485 [Imleria badia]|nr:hypothetical protein OG21DRAFT_102485 [Imleria badia]
MPQSGRLRRGHKPGRIPHAVIHVPANTPLTALHGPRPTHARMSWDLRSARFGSPSPINLYIYTIYARGNGNPDQDRHSSPPRPLCRRLRIVAPLLLRCVARRAPCSSRGCADVDGPRTRANPDLEIGDARSERRCAEDVRGFASHSMCLCLSPCTHRRRRRQREITVSSEQWK